MDSVGQIYGENLGQKAKQKTLENKKAGKERSNFKFVGKEGMVV